jgi:hypothetical protein
MKRVSLGIAIALLAAAPAASADFTEGSATSDEPARPAPPGAAHQGASSTPPVVALALVGAYRGFLDLQAGTGGVALSVGSPPGPVSAQISLRLAGGRTRYGLGVFDSDLVGTIEWRADAGVRFGLGTGLAVFGVSRATSGPMVLSIGPEALARAGFDFGARRAVFLTLDMSVALQAGGTAVFGPSLGVGYRF